MSATNQEVRLDEEDVKAKVAEEKLEVTFDKEDINTGNVSELIGLRNAIITPPNGPVCPKGMVLGADGVCRDPF